MCLIEHHPIKTYCGVDVQLHHSWPHHLMEVGVSFMNRPLYIWRKSPHTHWIEIWVSLGADLDTVGNRTPTVQLVARCSTDWAILAFHFFPNGEVVSWFREPWNKKLWSLVLLYPGLRMPVLARAISGSPDPTSFSDPFFLGMSESDVWFMFSAPQLVPYPC
jgi:hypothetical protein